jgi:signal transduction histidine kinase
VPKKTGVLPDAAECIRNAERGPLSTQRSGRGKEHCLPLALRTLGELPDPFSQPRLIANLGSQCSGDQRVPPVGSGSEAILQAVSEAKQCFHWCGFCAERAIGWMRPKRNRPIVPEPAKGEFRRKSDCISRECFRDGPDSQYPPPVISLRCTSLLCAIILVGLVSSGLPSHEALRLLAAASGIDAAGLPTDASAGIEPSFWWRIIGAVLLLLGAALLWVWMLRREVAGRTQELAAANALLSAEIEQRSRAQADADRALANERELGELKSRFVSLVSHEFRTPLSITISAVELLRHYAEKLTPQKSKELLDDIHAATLRMSGLMEQVLLLGKVEAGKIGFQAAPLDLLELGGKLADEVLSATNHRCPIEFSAEGTLANSRGDEGLIRHIFANLLSNAAKYTPSGAPVRFSVMREGDHAVFHVRDRGLGIPLADQPRLFEAFHRASNVAEIPGTGLGLLIVKRCVELHQGSISFESQVGEGTTFIVRLPLFP